MTEPNPLYAEGTLLEASADDLADLADDPPDRMPHPADPRSKADASEPPETDDRVDERTGETATASSEPATTETAESASTADSLTESVPDTDRDDDAPHRIDDELLGLAGLEPADISEPELFDLSAGETGRSDQPSSGDEDR